MFTNINIIYIYISECQGQKNTGQKITIERYLDTAQDSNGNGVITALDARKLVLLYTTLR